MNLPLELAMFVLNSCYYYYFLINYSFCDNSSFVLLVFLRNSNAFSLFRLINLSYALIQTRNSELF